MTEAKYNQVKYNTLNSGFKIPRLGFGTYDLKDAEEETYQALKAGYRHIDTATFYFTEEGVGKAIKRAIAEGLLKREDLFITTKLWGDDKEDLEKALKTSLEKLQLDYVDLYLIHFPLGKCDDKALKLVKQIPLHITWKEMEAQVKAGRVKSIGVSNFNVQLLIDLLSYAEIPPAVNEIELHPYNVQEDLVQFLQKNNILPDAYCPIGGNIPQNPPFTVKDLLNDSLIKELAAKYNKTPAQIVLNWHLSRGYTAIPKSSNPDRQKENIAADSFEMSPEDLKKISNLDRKTRVVPGTHLDKIAKIPVFA